MKVIVEYIEDCKRLNKEVDKNIILNIITISEYIEEWDIKDSKIEDKILNIRKEHSCELNDIQYSCEHPIKRYVPDASGNNDSHYYCAVCRKKL